MYFSVLLAVCKCPLPFLLKINHYYYYKGVASNGACFYTALAQELWGDATAWKTFRRLCHAYLLAWLSDHYRDFVIGSLPLHLIVGVGNDSRIETINTVDEYRQFLMTEERLLAWADPNWEMQNVCNVFGINLNIFVYGRSNPLESRQYMNSMQPNPDVLCLSNDKIPAKHTIYLYYQDQTQYESIIARPQFCKTS